MCTCKLWWQHTNKRMKGRGARASVFVQRARRSMWAGLLRTASSVTDCCGCGCCGHSYYCYC